MQWRWNLLDQSDTGKKNSAAQKPKQSFPSGVAKKCVDAKLGHTLDKELDRSM
jgi:hypothetical protein